MEDGFVPFDSKEFNFTSYLSNARERFTGRLWLYNELETNLMKQDTDRGVLVIGEPDAGKSALTAQLICSRSSNPFIHKRMVTIYVSTQTKQLKTLVDLFAIWST